MQIGSGWRYGWQNKELKRKNERSWNEKESWCEEGKGLRKIRCGERGGLIIKAEVVSGETKFLQK